MTKYSLVMTPTPVKWLDALYLLGIGRYACARALTYLLTYTVGSGCIKPAISPKRMKIEQKLLLTAYKVVHWLSIAAKMYDLE